MVTNETTLLVLSNPDQAYIAQVALNDKRLPAKELGVLLYLCNMQGKISPVDLVLDRFGRERTWWHRCFKVLEKLGYAKFHKTSAGYNKFITVYVVTDDPEYLLDYDIEAMRTRDKVLKNMQPRNVADIQNLIDARMNTAKEPPPQEVKPINPGRTYQNKKAKIAQQMRFIDPLTTGQEDYDLQKFYLSNNYPIPQEPEEWEEAKKPGMQLYARVTRDYPGWIKAAYINSRLGSNPDEVALNLAWMNWTAMDFKPGNVKGILDWYIAFQKDSDAKPWERGRGGNNNGSRYTGNSKKSKREHGTAPKPTKPTEFVSVE